MQRFLPRPTLWSAARRPLRSRSWASTSPLRKVPPPPHACATAIIATPTAAAATAAATTTTTTIFHHQSLMGNGPCMPMPWWLVAYAEEPR